MKIKILYEDKDIAVIHKPAGIATQSGRIGSADVVSELKNYLSRTDGGIVRGTARDGKKPPYVGIVHRLDQPVEGILAVGKTPEATAALSRQLGGAELHKRYYAVICGQVREESGELVDYLWKDNRSNSSIVVEEKELAGYPEAKRAELTYSRLSCVDRLSLMDIRIRTGRHHQIRVQMAKAGMPLACDSKYGSPQSIAVSREYGVRNVALCAYYLKFIHPVTKKEMEYTVSPMNPVFEIFKNVL